MREEKILGYDESEIKKSFHSKEMKVVNTTKIQPEKRTTETLVEGSKELLEENSEFLREIFGK